MATLREIAAMGPRQLAEWLIAETPITRAGFGRDLVERMRDLIRARKVAAQDDGTAAAQDLIVEAQNAQRLATYNECLALIDDAIALGDAPGARITDERNALLASGE